MAKFLSDEWFSQVEGFIKEAGELDIPKAMRDVVVNVAIHSGAGQTDMCINRGVIQRGRVGGADVEMSMPDDYALKILVQGDWSAGMKGWVGRKIKVTGNMRKLIPLQVFKPTDAQERLRRRIEEITET